MKEEPAPPPSADEESSDPLEIEVPNVLESILRQEERRGEVRDLVEQLGGVVVLPDRKWEKEKEGKGVAVAAPVVAPAVVVPAPAAVMFIVDTAVTASIVTASKYVIHAVVVGRVYYI